MICDAYFKDVHYQENLLVKYYLKNGHSVVILAATFEDVHKYYNDQYDPTIAPSIIEQDGYKIYRLKYGLNFMNKLRNFGDIMPILETEAPDLIFVHDIHFNLHHAIKYKKLHPGTRVIMDFHADYSNSGKNWLSIQILHKVVRNFYLKSCSNHLDELYSVVPGGINFLEDLYGISRERVKLLPLGTDLDLAEEFRAKGHREKMRKKLGIPQEATVVFTGGKLMPYKKTEQLIKAVNKEENRSLYLIIAGQVNQEFPAYKEEIERLIAENEKVIYTGWLNSEQIYEHMAASDVAVFPASQTVLWQQCLGMGLVLIIGRYITLHDGRKFDQEVEYLNLCDNIRVLYEKEDKVEEIASLLHELNSDPVLLDQLKKNALKAAAEYISYDIVAKRTTGELDLNLNYQKYERD